MPFHAFVSFPIKGLPQKAICKIDFKLKSRTFGDSIYQVCTESTSKLLSRLCITSYVQVIFIVVVTVVTTLSATNITFTDVMVGQHFV